MAQRQGRGPPVQVRVRAKRTLDANPDREERRGCAKDTRRVVRALEIMQMLEAKRRFECYFLGFV